MPDVRREAVSIRAEIILITGKEKMMSAGRDMELKVIMDNLADWRRKNGVRHITVSVEGNGHGHAHGWDGNEKICITGQYGSFVDSK